jgi:hypothetical protein
LEVCGNCQRVSRGEEERLWIEIPRSGEKAYAALGSPFHLSHDLIALDSLTERYRKDAGSRTNQPFDSFRHLSPTGYALRTNYLGNSRCAWPRR